MSVNEEEIVFCYACRSPMSVGSLQPYSRVACPQCGEENRVKNQFGPYRVTKRHAIGGMSSVFAAIDETLNREVALKILSEEYSKDEKRIVAFEEEARLTASFSHPHVVKILTTGRAFGHFFIAMEFVPGGHFEQRIYEKGKLSEAEVLPLAIQIAEGLKGAQTAGLIHRDIKPGNILFDAQGNAKIVDFGLALVTKGGEAKADEIWATPYYVPPETIEGGVEDFRSDVYAFGATLYHALAGIPPCNEASMDTKLLRAAKTKVVPLKRVAPDVSHETCEIIDRAMAYHPKNRFGSYDEMIASFRASIKSLEGGAGSVGATTSQLRKRSIVRAKQKRLYFGLAAVVGLIGLGVLLLLSNKDQSEADAKPVMKVVNVRPSRTDSSDSKTGASSTYQDARDSLKKGDYVESEKRFKRLFSDPKIGEPTRTWAGMESVVISLLDARMQDARSQARVVREHVEKHSDQLPQAFVNDLIPALRSLDRFELVEIGAAKTLELSNEQLMGCLIIGLKNWEQGGIAQAAPFFEKIMEEVDAENTGAVSGYRSMVASYLDDYQLLNGDAMKSIPENADECRNMIEELNRVRSLLKTQGRAKFNVRSRQQELAQHEKYLANRQKRSRD